MSTNEIDRTVRITNLIRSLLKHRADVGAMKVACDEWRTKGRDAEANACEVMIRSELVTIEALDASLRREIDAE